MKNPILQVIFISSFDKILVVFYGHMSPNSGYYTNKRLYQQFKLYWTFRSYSQGSSSFNVKFCFCSDFSFGTKVYRVFRGYVE